MNIERLSLAVRQLLDHSLAFPERAIDATIIANPRAGGFTRTNLWKRHQAELSCLEAESCALPRRATSPHLRVIQTERPRHASFITDDLIVMASQAPLNVEFVIIAAGGDGTSLEILSRLIQAPQELRERFTIIRLPMGTGNDGSDGADLIASLGLLIRPTSVEKRGAIKLSAQGIGEARWAFNIASIGLDAYVTHMTNKLKGVMPGDSYKLWLDIATLFYDKAYRVRPMKIELSSKGRADIERLELPLLILAMGESGHRTYGSHVPILPGDENVCFVKQMSLAKKLALKPLVNAGKHAGHPSVFFRNADRAFIQYSEKLLAQCDGETLDLVPENFPLTMERVEGLFRILEFAKNDKI